MKVMAVKNIIKTISFGTTDNTAKVNNTENINANKQNLNFEKKLNADTVELSTKENKKGLIARISDYYRQAREVSESVPYSVHVPYYLA